MNIKAIIVYIRIRALYNPAKDLVLKNKVLV